MPTSKAADLFADFDVPLTIIYGRVACGKSLFARALARAASEQKQLVVVLDADNPKNYMGMDIVLMSAGFNGSVQQVGLEALTERIKRMKVDLLVVDGPLTQDGFSQLMTLLAAMPTVRCVVTLSVHMLTSQLFFIARALPERSGIKMMRIDVSQTPPAMVAVARGQEIEFEPYPVWFDAEANAFRVGSNPEAPVQPD